MYYKMEIFKDISKDEIIIYTLMIISMISVLLLWQISPQIKPELMPIENVTMDLLEKNVYVEGKIKEVYKLKDNSKRLKFYNTNIEVYITKNVKAEFEKYQKVRLIGTVKLYKGKLEIIVDDIKKIEFVED